MKLLLDQNLSRYLARILAGTFPETAHVQDFDLDTSEDETIWRFAAREGFTILTKDTDFFHRSLLRGHPPKVIQVRAGNCSTAELVALLVADMQRIQAFGTAPDESVLVL